MINRMASDEVTDGIAAIEMHRQGTEKESGLAAACSEALRKLQQLLEQEKEALQLNATDPVSVANVDAVANEIKRIQAMAGIKGQGPAPRNVNARPRGERQVPRADKAHNAPRNRGRRTMGRTGGRSGGGGGGGGSSGGGSGGR
jgi:hypothetical protein